MTYLEKPVTDVSSPFLSHNTRSLTMINIVLTIQDDGSMTVGASTDGSTDPNNMKTTPVKDLPAALDAIKQLASAASMQQPGDDSAQDGQPEPDADDQAQEEAMMGSYRGGSTGR